MVNRNPTFPVAFFHTVWRKKGWLAGTVVLADGATPPQGATEEKTYNEDDVVDHQGGVVAIHAHEAKPGYNNGSVNGIPV